MHEGNIHLHTFIICDVQKISKEQVRTLVSAIRSEIFLADPQELIH